MKAAKQSARLASSTIRFSAGPTRCYNSRCATQRIRSSSQLRRSFTSNRIVRAETTSSQDEIRAAPEINFDSDVGNNKTLIPETKGKPSKLLRIVPASPSYFSGQPAYTDDYLQLEATLRKYVNLPTVKPSDAPRVAWVNIETYRKTTGEPVRVSRFGRITKMLARMNLIHPELIPEEVMTTMNAWKSEVQPHMHKPFPIVVDEFGRAPGLGRRKSSSAKAWLVEGEGEILINGKSLSQTFGRVHDRESAIWPLKATERIGMYNVFATVFGGGTTGQAEAVTLAITRALLVHEPLLKPILRKAGCVTRDPRRVERKKPGRRKARKMPQWVKR